MIFSDLKRCERLLTRYSHVNHDQLSRGFRLLRAGFENLNPEFIDRHSGRLRKVYRVAFLSWKHFDQCDLHCADSLFRFRQKSIAVRAFRNELRKQDFVSHKASAQLAVAFSRRLHRRYLSRFLQLKDTASLQLHVQVGDRSSRAGSGNRPAPTSHKAGGSRICDPARAGGSRFGQCFSGWWSYHPLNKR
jgi:hypothetical protein